MDLSCPQATPPAAYTCTAQVTVTGARVLAAFVSGLYVLYGIVFLIIGARRFGWRLLRLPQWTLLLPIGVLASVGAFATD